MPTAPPVTMWSRAAIPSRRSPACITARPAGGATSLRPTVTSSARRTTWLSAGPCAFRRLVEEFRRTAVRLHHFGKRDGRTTPPFAFIRRFHESDDLQGVLG